jgi:pSer/pThr/pTyr-binding forkhead associated (FHA) protein
VAKMIISRDAQLVQEVELGVGRLTIGRHPHNDIVLAHQAVSGRHAAVTFIDGVATLEDLGSSNGTFVNGQRITRAVLSDRDLVTIAAFKIDYVVAAAPAPAPLPFASIEVLNGPSAGKTLSLLKPLTTLGSPGVLVVVIGREAAGYHITQVQGETAGRLNDQALDHIPRLLRDGDMLELTGTRMRFSAKYC